MLCALLHLSAWMIAPTGNRSHAEERPKAVGILSAMEGDVLIRRDRETEYRPARLHEVIHERDRLGTGEDGKAQIDFEDDTVVVLGTNSELTVEQYQYRRRSRKRKVLLGLLQGKIRFLVSKFFVQRVIPRSKPPRP